MTGYVSLLICRKTKEPLIPGFCIQIEDMSRLTRKVSFPISCTPLTHAIGKKKKKLAVKEDLLTIN